jgi:ASC-1-like (ASCH) protein
MALKPDEEFVKNCLLKHFGARATAWEGEDPPDIYIKVKGKTIAVEITRLSPVSFDQDGVPQNRNTQDCFGINLCNELDSKLKNDVPPEVDILLILYIPVENARKYKKELHACLKETLAKGIKSGDRLEFNLSGAKVNIAVIPNRDDSLKKIVGGIVNNNSSPHIQSNAAVILADRILDKIEKCKNIQHQVPLWLALYNDYWLADYETYSQAINNISIQHYFEKIFVVSDTGVVNQIY